MLTVDEVLPFLGCPLDQRRVESLFGTSGHRSADELDPSHPQDQRHYYSFPEFGIQFILGENDVIQTIFFHIEGDPDVAPYPWSFENGINPSSTRNDVLASFGRPERSGKPNADGTIAAEGWDRFKSYANFIHLQYATGGAGIAMITAMVAAASPPMPIPLDYKSPDHPPRLHWHRRVPIFLLFIILLTPPLLLTPMCSRLPSGAKLPPEETLAGGLGIPIVLTLAFLSFQTSSTARKVGLTILIILCFLGIAAALTYALM